MILLYNFLPISLNFNTLLYIYIYKIYDNIYVYRPYINIDNIKFL